MEVVSVSCYDGMQGKFDHNGGNVLALGEHWKLSEVSQGAHVSGAQSLYRGIIPQIFQKCLIIV